MKKTKFKCLDRETSMLGMGVMRLRMDDDGHVDETYAIETIRHAIDCGIDFIDTGYFYLRGKSEVLIGKALKDGYRDRVILSDKLPIYAIPTLQRAKDIFYEQYERLDLEPDRQGRPGYFDMYHIHDLRRKSWDVVKKENIIGFLEEKKREGLIRHIGFSSHAERDEFKELIDAYDWDFCLIQLNYVDRDIQAGLEGLEYARSKGVDVMIMEPLKGGRLTDSAPPAVLEIWEEGKRKGIIPEDRSLARTAFGWVAAQKGVTLILSGMNSAEMIDRNIELFSDPTLGTISEEEDALISKAAETYNGLIKYQCTGCGYCKPCAKKIDIPSVISYLNAWLAYGHTYNTRFEYMEWIGGKHASDCIKCGKCEKACPQSLKIMDIMDEAAREFGK